MEAYTFDGALTSYADLTSIQCDNDGGGTNGASRVQFFVVYSRQYLVAVEGVNGASGTAWLNYSLDTNQLPAAPQLLSPAQGVTVAEGSPALLTASFTGTPPLRYSWKKNTTLIPGINSATVYFPNTTNTDAANYLVTVTNDLGSSSATLPLRVLVQPRCSLTRTSTWLQLSFPTVTDQRYTVEEAVAVTGPWEPWPNFFIGDGQPLQLNVPGDGTRFYRVHLE